MSEEEKKGQPINPFYGTPAVQVLFYFETLLWGEISNFETWLKIIAEDKTFPDIYDTEAVGISDAEFEHILAWVQHLKEIVGDAALHSATAYVNAVYEKRGHLKGVEKIFKKE